MRLEGFPPEHPLQQITELSVQDTPLGSHALGVGAGGVGAGGVGAGGGPDEAVHADHQHTFPPFPQLSPWPSVVQSPLAVEPSAQIEEGRGSFFVHTYLNSVAINGVGEEVVGRDVGKGVGSDVGKGVGDSVSG